MIAAIVSAIKGPILFVLSGCLGESGLGNDSHFRNIFGIILPRIHRATEKQPCQAYFPLLGERLIVHGLDRGGMRDI